MCTRIERGVAIKFAHIYVAVVVYLRHTVLNPRAAILYKLKLDQTVSTISTVGFNVETFTYKKVKFTVWVRFFYLFLMILHSAASPMLSCFDPTICISA